MGRFKIYREDESGFVILNYDSIQVTNKELELKDKQNRFVTRGSLAKGTLYILGSIVNKGQRISACFITYGKISKESEMLIGILYQYKNNQYTSMKCFVDIVSDEYKLVADAYSKANRPLPEPKLNNIDFFDNDEDTIYALPSGKIGFKMTCPADESKCIMHKSKVGNERIDRKFNYHECPECRRWYADISALRKINNFCAQNGFEEIEYYIEEDLKREVNYIRKNRCHKVIANGQINDIPNNYPVHKISFAELNENAVIVVSDYNFCTLENHYTGEDSIIICVPFERKSNPQRIERLLFLKATYCSSCQKYFISSDDYKTIANKGRLRVNVIDDNKKFNVTSGQEFDKEKDILLKYENSLSSYMQMIKPPVERYYKAFDENDKYNHDQEVKKYKAQFEELDRVALFDNNPYRFRLVMKNLSNNTIHEYLLGVDTISFNNKEQVQSIWGPIGKIYKKSRETTFTFEGNKYQILLRREVDIQGKTLYGFFDVYNSDDMLFQSGITDPFLISVLRKRQTQHQLTDILTTIQKKQNDIIEQPYKRNLIVQGCAGSGKTMVMLHRLSYFVSEEPLFDPPTTKIITPNKHFDMHINNLAIDLRINSVKRLTVEEYYVFLIKQYDKSYKLPNPNIQPENKINSDFLDYIYGNEYVELVKQMVSSLMSELYSDIKEDINIYFEKLNISDEFQSVGHKNLLSYINYAQSIGNTMKDTYNTLKNELSSLRNDYKLYEKQLLKLSNEGVSENDLKKQYEKLEEIKSKIENNIINVLTDDEIKRTEEIIGTLTRTSAVSIHREFISNIYVERNITISGTYRFYLYSLLLFLHNSLGRGMGNDSLLCFDEGQDISINEYRLIFDVNAQETIFNIYGDTNQLIKSNVRGLESWTPMINKLHSGYFDLNENYRNTNQITRFCNEYFNQNNSCTGIDGEDVEYIKPVKLESLINDMDIEEKRIAVVYCDRNNDLYFDKSRLYPDKRALISDSVEAGKICVSNVENVKGIEFDIVFAVTKDMSINEKYVAFTRPLSKLYIVE